jgi:hypothetical protein
MLVQFAHLIYDNVSPFYFVPASECFVMPDIEPQSASESGAAPSASDFTDEDRLALRWRKAILRLSENFMDAAGERSDLSPILMEAMHNALDNLLVYGEATDLMVLEEWLSIEEAEVHQRVEEKRRRDRRQLERRQQKVAVAVERRAATERRAEQRRALRDWRFDDVQ